MLHYIIFFDSCAFYPPQFNEKEAINKLFELDEKEIIQLEITEATDEEMQKAPAKLKDRFYSRICSLERTNLENNTEFLLLKKILFPGKPKLDSNEHKDARALFIAKKYGCDIFVTTDEKHILSKAIMIKQKLKIDALRPTQCLEIVLDKIKWNKEHDEKMKDLKNLLSRGLI